MILMNRRSMQACITIPSFCKNDFIILEKFRAECHTKMKVISVSF